MEKTCKINASVILFIIKNRWDQGPVGRGVGPKFYSFFCFFRERNFYVLQILTSQNQIFYWEKQLFFVQTCYSTMKSCYSTMKSCYSTMESCYSTMKCCYSTMKSSQSTREQKYEENGRILHNLAFVWSKSIKIEHGPAISIACLDLRVK